MEISKDQKIINYFLEEALEHLETLEKGILKLAEDPEVVQEMFRAAHSIKGGAGMLGFSDIQKMAHRLEDLFKILQEKKNTPDSKLERLLLLAYDNLKNLLLTINQEQSEILRQSEAIFLELGSYLQKKQSLGIVAHIRELLLEMLEIFKQKADSQNRYQLKLLCDELQDSLTGISNWSYLLETAKKAIANPSYDYSILAPVVMTNLKRAYDLINLEKADEIIVSQGLLDLTNQSSVFVLVPLEPRAIASTLVSLLNSEQINQLSQILAQVK